MEDNPQTTPSETPPAAAPVTPPTSAPMTGYPQPSAGTPGVASQDERTQAMLMWILSIIIYIVSPIIFYVVGKDKPFLYRHAANGLAFQIVMLIAWFIAGMLAFLLIGFLLFPIIGILNLIICIMGAMAASRGESYEPPLAAGLARSWFKV